jgi:hypothetical protein
MTKEKIPMLKLGALVQFCLLLGVKQTSLPHRKMSAFDPKRTSLAFTQEPNAMHSVAALVSVAALLARHSVGVHICARGERV